MRNPIPLSSSRPDVIVLGAGIVGISTAYYLNKQGFDVTVVDRLPGAGLETSYANGGQVSVSHAEPWANPSAPLKVLKWLGRDDSPLLFRPRFDPQQWAWLAGWLVECLPSRSRANTVKILELALASRACIQDIRAAEGFPYDHKAKGILHFYRDQKEFDAAVPVAEMMRAYGCDREVIDRKRVVELEPAFAPVADRIVGATYTATDESGDAQAFTAGLADVCRRNGVTFRWNTEATGISAEGGRFASVEVKDLATARYERLPAAAVVVSLAAWSPRIVRPLGIHLNIYPAKGYSVTIPVAGHTGAPQVSLTDDEYKLVYSRLGDRLRVAGTAELSGYDRNLNPVRAQAILDNVRDLFPEAGDFDAAAVWTGLRPTTPSNVPYLGRSKVAGLYLNTGHGTLGWTMGPGSGARVAEIIRGDLGSGIGSTATPLDRAA
jgi:D-amino-acid dehydrogenase